MSVRAYRASPSSTSCILGVVAGRLRVAGDGLSCHLRGRASKSSRGRRARGETEAEARRGSARSSGAGPHGAGYADTSGAGYAGRAARCQDDGPQPGPQYHLCTDGDGADHDQPQHHRGAATGRERNGRKDRFAISRSYPGFGGQRQFPCPQRARQCAIRINGIILPDGVLVSASSSTLPSSAACPSSPARCRRIRPAHLRRPRDHDAQRRLQQCRQRRRLRRQPGNVTPSVDYGGTSGRSNTFSPAGTSEEYRHRKSDAELECHPRPYRARARVRLRLDPARSLHAVHLHHRRLLRALPDSRHPRPAVELHRLRRLQLQFGAAQREPARAELFWHCGGATLDQRR